MKIKKLRNLIFASLFAAIICLFNAVIRIPAPGGSGFLNIGDAFVIAGGMFLGPYGIASAVAGGVLSDIITGFPVYVPASALLKGFCALIVFLFCRNKKSPGKMIISSLIGEIVTAVGYFLYEYFILSLTEGAVVNIPFNLLQGVISILVALIIYKPIKKIFKEQKNNERNI